MTSQVIQIDNDALPSPPSYQDRENIEPSTPTPLPNPQFTILLIIRFIEPVGFTLLFPFVYFMVKDFNITDDPTKIAYYAGLIASSFALCEVLSGIPWGMLSDRIGRKPVLIMGLIGTCISMFLFGLSKNLIWAILSRSCCGLLNGNIGVLKSMVAEMTDRTNRASAFGYISLMYGLGSIVGPILGGFLSNPVINFPWLFGGNQFLIEYPYFLPCFVASFLCFVGTFFAYFYLEETLVSLKSDKEDLILNENTPLLKNTINLNQNLNNYVQKVTTTTTIVDEPIPTSLETLKVAEESLNNTIQSSTSSTTTIATTTDTTISYTTWLVMFSNIGISLLTVIVEELLPFWAATDSLFGGLDFQPFHIGVLLSFSAILTFFFQIFIYPRLQQQFTTLKLFKLVFFIYIPILFFLPKVAYFALFQQYNYLWTSLLFLYGLRTCCGVVAFTSYNILLPESCPNKNILGQVNGISQALGSLMRGIGPTLCGIIYSWSLVNNWGYPFDINFTFYVCIGLCCLCYIIVDHIDERHVVY